MNRQTVLIAIAILAVFAGLVAVVSWQRSGSDDAIPGLDDAQQAAAGVAADADVWTVSLFFPGTGTRLRAERHELPPSDDATARVASLVTALLAGPRGAGMRSPLPDTVALRKVYLSDDGTAYLDLESPDGAPPPASGSTREMLTVYSLVNSVLLNFEEIETLVLLWNGRQLETFAGHLDTTRPLLANTDLIGEPP